MTDLLTAAQMRAIEQAAIDSGEVTGLELMERAGAGVVDAIFEWRPDLTEGDRRAVVLCGPGNNGGDGFVVARLLKERGWAVDVFLYGEEAKLPPDAAENCRRWRAMGEINSHSRRAFNPDKNDGALYIDALIGGGLSRPLEGDLFDACRHIYGLKGTIFRRFAGVVAIDAPSGLCLDSGRAIVRSRRPQHIYTGGSGLTVTFQRPRLGHVIGDGPQHAQNLAVVDIGIDPWLTIAGDLTSGYVGAAIHGPDIVRKIVLSIEPLEKGWIGPRHKYSHGHAVVVSGGIAQTGAARLAARGALRIGAGLVTVASPPNALMENAAHLTAIMVHKMKGAEGLADILTDERINAVVIGPGCGISEETRGLVEVALEIPPAPDSIRGLDRQRVDARGPASRAGQRSVILDADALTSYAGDPDTLFTAIKASPCSVILTPHGGEFARLFPDIAAKLAEPPTKGPAYSKVDATRDAAARSGATVLYKGPDTVIAEPNGRCSVAAAVYERAAPWLATAGSGDVLAGMIAGLAARGAHDPAASAAWLHQECGRHLGPGLIAEDIPEAIPSVLKQVLGWKAPTES